MTRRFSVASLIFGVRDHCVQRGRAGSRAPIPLLGLGVVFCWLVCVLSVLRTDILENSMILSEVNEKEKLGRRALPPVTLAVWSEGLLPKAV